MSNDKCNDFDKCKMRFQIYVSNDLWIIVSGFYSNVPKEKVK